MKIIILSLLVLISSTDISVAEADLGVGIISVDIDALPTLMFYKSPAAFQPDKIISVVKDARGEIVLKNQADVLRWFEPEGLHLDYYIFIIRCKTKQGHWCEVYVNHETEQTLWLRLDKTFSYMDWATFLHTRTTSITLPVSYRLPIQAGPSDSALRIRMIEKEDCFEVIQIKGDWMQIRTNTVLECSESTRPLKTGWIKWRKTNKLLIAYGLTC